MLVEAALEGLPTDLRNVRQHPNYPESRPNHQIQPTRLELEVHYMGRRRWQPFCQLHNTRVEGST